MKVSPDYARRDAFVGWLVNQVLRLASSRYRAVIGGAIRYGMRAAAKDERADKELLAEGYAEQADEAHDLCERPARCGVVFTGLHSSNHLHGCIWPWGHGGIHLCTCGASTQYVAVGP